MHKTNYQRKTNVFVSFLVLFRYIYFKGYLQFQSGNGLLKLFYLSTLYANRLPVHLFLILRAVWKGKTYKRKKSDYKSPENENILLLYFEIDGTCRENNPFSLWMRFSCTFSHWNRTLTLEQSHRNNFIFLMFNVRPWSHWSKWQRFH